MFVSFYSSFPFVAFRLIRWFYYNVAKRHMSIVIFRKNEAVRHKIFTCGALQLIIKKAVPKNKEGIS